MTVLTSWTRFRRLVLDKKMSKRDVEGARNIFYCGCAAATDRILKVLGTIDITPDQKIARLNKLADELELYRASVAKSNVEADRK